MKKIFLQRKWLLIGIIVLAFILRFYRLGSYPAFNADEASIGYDAYSLLQTGKDQHGNSWPVSFQSFNDYKPGLYVYIVMPFVKILGLNEWAVRLPNALVGVVSVYIVYLLVGKLAGRRFSLLAAFFLAISPWHIHFSRGGWEANVATFLIAVGVLFFVSFVNSQRNVWYLVGSGVALVASMYCYQATRVVGPLVGIGLILIYRREVISSKRLLIIVGAVGLVLLIPLVVNVTKGSALARVAGVGLFADPGPRSRIEEQRGEHGDVGSLMGKVLHNKIVNYGLAFVYNWGKHFHGEFLFLSGDEVQRNKVPETGEMYIFEVLFLVVGGWLVVGRINNKGSQVFLMWIIGGPVASALTFQSPSALRAENLVIPLVSISSIGAMTVIDFLKKIKLIHIRNMSFVVISLMIMWGVGRYLQMYYVHMAKEYPYSSQYGVKELVNYIRNVQDKYQKIVITDRYDQPYILFLFYGAASGMENMEPGYFQGNHSLTGRDGFGFSTVNHFDKYYFTSIKYDQARVENPNSLLVGTSEEIPKEANIVQDIYGTNNYLYFRAVAN